MCIATVCEPSCDVIDFEIEFILLIKPFFDMTKKSIQKFKYLENEKSILSALSALNCKKSS